MSGTPYHFWRAANQQGFPMRAIDLPPTRDLRLSGHVWRAHETLHGRPPFGYMFSMAFLEKAWKVHRGPLDGIEIVNNFQLFPPSLLRLAEKGLLSISFYIDLTLKELFESYRLVRHHGAHLKRNSLLQEQRGYDLAKRIVTFSHSSAAVLRSEYRVDPAKVRTVVPGANLDDALVESRMRPERREPAGVFRVGFVGLDYKRKGLLPLADAVLALRQKKVPICLRIIGAAPRALRNVDGIEFIGPVSKATDMRRFIDLLEDCDLGVLPSAAEGTPIAIMEFLRLGIPVLATSVNGIPDAVTGGSGILIDPDFTSRDLLAVLADLVTDSDRYADLRTNAKKRKDFASWRRAVAEFRAAISE